MFREMEEEQVQELLNFAGMNEPPPKEDGEPAEEDENENIGNRIDHGREARRQKEIDDDVGNRIPPPSAAQREADGNRGTYDPNAAPRPPKAGPRRPHGAKPFAFKKRGAQGGQPPAAQGQGQGQGHGQGQKHHRRQGQGQGHGQGQGPAAGPVAGQPPAAGKGGRNRNRGRNRNKARGANEGRGGGERGEQQPASNANRDPYRS